MSPEQLEGSYNELCDVWACGCIAYEFVFKDKREVLVTDERGASRAATLQFLRSPSFRARLNAAASRGSEAVSIAVL
eukprot:282900-Karenia_brevis.AAC.1